MDFFFRSIGLAINGQGYYKFIISCILAVLQHECICGRQSFNYDTKSVLIMQMKSGFTIVEHVIILVLAFEYVVLKWNNSLFFLCKVKVH